MKSLILFDVDGTITDSGYRIKDDMIGLLYRLKNKENIELGILGGGSYNKHVEQLGEETLKLFKWTFSENGLVAYKDGELINNEKITERINKTSFNHLVNICLNELSKTENTCKRGNFIQIRNGMINISPIGRDCNQKERETFFEQDKIFEYRKKLIEVIKRRWEKYSYESEDDIIELQFTIGGMISIDIFPKGWDKTYCLDFVRGEYDKIYFLGDNTFEGGNDYEIFNHPLTIGFTVKDTQNTMDIINSQFLSDNIFQI